MAGFGGRYGSPTPEQEKLAFLRQEIEAAESELVEREAELLDLRAEYHAFQLRYEARLGRKLTELEKVERELARCRQRIDAYRQWGPEGPSFVLPGQAYIPVDEQYRRTWQEPRLKKPPPPRRPVSEAIEADIKKLYRQLCRRFHPDLAREEQERAWRTRVMAAVNAAYSERNLAELQALAARPDRPEAAEPQTDQQVLVALREKLRQIRRRLEEVNREIRELTHSEMVKLSLDARLAQRQGRDLLAELARQVGQDLLRKQVELDLILDQMRELGIEPH